MEMSIFLYVKIPVWFTCGCACMAAEKYEDAVRAFRRCVNIDYDVSNIKSNFRFSVMA